MANLEQQVQTLQKQIIDLQIQFTYQEQTIRALDEVIQEQYKEIDTLKQQQAKLIKLLEVMNTTSGNTTQYEKPPHY